jgi:PAS domain S-box-containing protein
MAKLLHRAGSWLRDRVRVVVEWPSRAELTRLRDQRRRFLAVLDAVEDAVVLKGPDGALRFMNRHAASLLTGLTGRGPEELIGSRPAELGLPEDLTSQIATLTERVNATRAPVTNESPIPQPGGGSRWYEQKISPVIVDGEVTSHVIIGRDIDERKRAQRRLELLSKVSALVGTLDPDELLPAIAKLSVPELADWSAVDVRGDETVRRMYVAQSDPRMAAVAEQLQRFHPWREREGWSELVAGRSLLFEVVTDEQLRANAENEEHVALLRQLGLRSTIAVPLRLRGETLAVMTFATAESGRRFGAEDLALAEELARRAAAIIDRARLHADLKASEARFRVALAAGRTAVFEQDRELRYLWHYNWVLGVDAVGKTHADLFPPDQAEELTAIKQRVLDTGEPARAEVQLTMRGNTYAVTLAVDPVRDDAGAIVGIIGSGTDITNEKRVQEELAQAVTFREQLMGILGHDLRNPLGAITAASGLLRRRADLAASAREHVGRIERAATRMSEMIRTILDFTQVRFHGMLPVWPEPTDLAEVARAIVDELRATDPDRAIELDVRGDAHGHWDPARLGEALSNLVGNALVHGAAREPVRVAIDVDGDDVWLHVHNGGAAIAPELKAALFEPFRRGNGVDSGARAGGLGLGLYIVRQIVLAHGGAISVDSPPGGGTTFTLRLPRRARLSSTVAENLPA